MLVSEIKTSKELETFIGQLTTKEKVGQLNQRLYGWQCIEKVGDEYILTDYFKDEVEKFDGIGTIYGLFRSDPWSKINYDNGVLPADAKKVTEMLQDYVKKHTTHQIPILFSEEVPHGHQALDSVLYPTNIGMGATWNPALQEQIAAAISEELAYKGVHLGLISVVDILREPRWGRSEECFTEDPFLASQFSQAIVNGMQRMRDGYYQSVAVLKHLCAQGEPVAGHNSGAVSIGQRELREIFLPVVKSAIEAGAKSFMAAYNEIDGIPCHMNKKLLTNILREEYQFDGFIMADGVAIDRFLSEENCYEHAASLALNAGVDMSLWDTSFSHLEKSVEDNLVSMERLDEAVHRVLKTKMELGLFDIEKNDVTQFDREAAEALSLQAAKESIVLLKNDQFPLDKEKTYAVIGPNANDIYNQLGDYTSFQRENTGVTIYDGIKKYSSNSLFEKGSNIKSGTMEEKAAAVELAQNSDEIILVLGGSSKRRFEMAFDANGAVIGSSRGEDMNCGENMDMGDIDLPQIQKELFDALVETGKPITIILIQGRPHAIEHFIEKAANILVAWYPGPFGGEAMGQTLFGMTTPTGKLAVSIPRGTYQLPVFYNKKVDGSLIDYSNGSGEARYPFGYGLTNTTFKMSQPQLVDSNTVEITITNTGDTEGTETVQLYINAPLSDVTRRVKELKAYKKVTLKPGQTERVSFDLLTIDWEYWNQEEMYVETNGIINLYIGDSSRTDNKVQVKKTNQSFEVY